MARRSSARLRGRESSTPKRVSLSHDAPIRTPRTLPARLASLDEEDDGMPGTFPRSVSPELRTPTRSNKRINTGAVQATPKNVTPIKPAEEEMRPQKQHLTGPKPMDEARYLGFQNMGAHTEPPKQKSTGIAQLQVTPSRATNNPANPMHDIKSPSFQFTFRREHSLELSSDAKRLMLEKREEAMRIREQMRVTEQDPMDVGESGRNVAIPNGKKGRFSGIHQEDFQKMQSIAGHASAFRAKTTALKDSGGEAVKSLKRSPSKAQLDDHATAAKLGLMRSPSKPKLHTGGNLPRPLSSHHLNSSVEPSSPAKRVKFSAPNDTRPQSSHSSNMSQPSTPQQKTFRVHPSNPNLAALTAATQASLARVASVKNDKVSMIPGPALTQSPSRPTLFEKKSAIEEAATPLLARSPMKAALFASAKSQAIEADEPASPLLSRSPLKPTMPKKVVADVMSAGGSQEQHVDLIPLLSRSPLKMSFARTTDSTTSDSPRQTKVSLLAQPPSKIALPCNAPMTQAPGQETPCKNSGLMSRFDLLRASPMKSILRSPQRLYSNDPAKIASGTHLATPPQKSREYLMASNKKVVAMQAPATPTPSSKKVDFSNSTKARYEGKEASSTPSKSTTPMREVDVEGIEVQAKAMDIDYPTLPVSNVASSPAIASPSPQKRRQTVAPGDFTFRAGNHGITFGQSPKSFTVSKRPSIRHVSAAPDIIPSRPVFTVAGPAPAVTGSKKRKFEFENDSATMTENKENDPSTSAVGVDSTAADESEHARPAKRSKTSSATEATASSKARERESSVSPVKRNPTLGVKPKGTKTVSGKEKERRETVMKGATGKANMISRERLNALAMPKKRG
ncbi:hypothetical protein LTR62_007250 [Meristemomyces frigidus]|uniref:Erythromycin esterase n=1 Tax=Meristemomyces frigidus TaxID=1508187 RepID=A0AAN7YDM8_9PEZI|nr:hypothetical protein LTR62_007250 [Meristemomyces frigidus]